MQAGSEVKIDAAREVGDLWILIWEELHRVHQEGTLVEVEHVTAHRYEKEIQQMSLFERFTTEGKDNADDPAKEEAMLDG